MPKPIIIEEKLCYYQLIYTKIHIQNLHKLVLEFVLLFMSSGDDFS